METRDQNGQIDPDIPQERGRQSTPNGQDGQGNLSSRGQSDPSGQSNPCGQSAPGSPDDRSNLNGQNGCGNPGGQDDSGGCGEESGIPGGCGEERGTGARLSFSGWLSVALSVLSALCLCAYFYLDARSVLTVAGRLLLLGGFVALSYPAARLYLRGKARGQSASPAGRGLFPLFSLYFALYLHLLLMLTLFDPSLGRDLIWAENSRAYYLEWYVNLRPFHTIWNVYIVGGLGKGLLSRASILLNLLGNLGMLSPLAVFLPLFFRPMRRFYVFLPTVLFATALIEALQFCFMRGSCDIDDLLLNAGGAFLFFLFLKLPPVSRFINRLTLGLWTAG